jgi:shikimate kinase
LWHDVGHILWGSQMVSLSFSKLQWFVGLTGSCAVLLALWMALVVLHRRRLERVAVILAAISAIATAYLYVTMWGFTIAPL